MPFILIRHAKSLHNQNNVFAGSQLDTELTPQGRKETESLGVNLADKYSFDTIICSNLLRTYQTSLIISKYQTKKYNRKVPIIKTPLLNEVDVGVLSGMNPSEASIHYPIDYNNYQSNNIEDWYFAQGESFPDLQKRYLKLIDYFKLYQHQNVLLVGHAMFNQIIAKNMLGINTCQFNNHNTFFELTYF